MFAKFPLKIPCFVSMSDCAPGPRRAIPGLVAEKLGGEWQNTSIRFSKRCMAGRQSMTTLRIGTRGSRLALWQANFVADRLRSLVGERGVDLVEIQTAGDQVRRKESKQLAAEGDDRLKGTRYGWLRNPLHETAKQRSEFEALRSSKLKTARAWSIKETLMDFFDIFRETDARTFFLEWHSWAIRSRLRPIERLARTLKSRLSLLMNWCRWPITNAASESLNSKIQWIKYTARGFRSREGYRRAIYFHCGALDLYPQSF